MTAAPAADRARAHERGARNSAHRIASRRATLRQAQRRLRPDDLQKLQSVLQRTRRMPDLLDAALTDEQ